MFGQTWHLQLVRLDAAQAAPLVESRQIPVQQSWPSGGEQPYWFAMSGQAVTVPQVQFVLDPVQAAFTEASTQLSPVQQLPDTAVHEAPVPPQGGGGAVQTLPVQVSPPPAGL